MPVKIKKVDGYQVSHGGKVSAKSTTKEKAQAQANLLRGISHGWEPTGKSARKASNTTGKDGKPKNHSIGRNEVRKVKGTF